MLLGPCLSSSNHVVHRFLKTKKLWRGSRGRQVTQLYELNNVQTMPQPLLLLRQLNRSAMLPLCRGSCQSHPAAWLILACQVHGLCLHGMSIGFRPRQKNMHHCHVGPTHSAKTCFMQLLPLLRMGSCGFLDIIPPTLHALTGMWQVGMALSQSMQPRLFWDQVEEKKDEEQQELQEQLKQCKQHEQYGQR